MINEDKGMLGLTVKDYTKNFMTNINFRFTFR